MKPSQLPAPREQGNTSHVARRFPEVLGEAVPRDRRCVAPGKAFTERPRVGRVEAKPAREGKEATLHGAHAQQSPQRRYRVVCPQVSPGRQTSDPARLNPPAYSLWAPCRPHSQAGQGPQGGRRALTPSISCLHQARATCSPSSGHAHGNEGWKVIFHVLTL